MSEWPEKWKLIGDGAAAQIDPLSCGTRRRSGGKSCAAAPFNLDRILPRLVKRGFPPADPDTGMFDLEAIDEWRRARNPQLFGLTTAEKPRDPREVFDERLARLGRR